MLSFNYRIFNVFLFFVLSSQISLGQVKKTVTVKPKPTSVKTTGYKTPEEYFLASLKLKDDSGSFRKFQFKKDTLQYQPKTFFIQRVECDSVYEDSIGRAIQPKSKRMQRYAFAEGTSAGFSTYLHSRVKRDSALYPVVFRIKKFNIQEERKQLLYDVGEIEYKFEVEVIHKNKLFKVSAYEGSGTLGSFPNHSRSYDSIIGMKLMELLRYTDEQVAELADNHPDFLKGVKLKFGFSKSKEPDGDTLFFDGSSTLLWSDFQGYASKRQSIYTYATIELDSDYEYEKGYLQINLRITPVFNRKLSWAGAQVRRQEVLLYERYKMKLFLRYSYVLRQRLELANITTENYRQIIKDYYHKVNEELTSVMQEYENETNLGLSQKSMQRWMEEIDEDLQKYNLKYRD
jgi:hypothetical protein